MCDPRYLEVLQEELELIGEVHAMEELVHRELDIPPDLKYRVMNGALARYFSELSNTAGSLLFTQIKTTVREALDKGCNGPPYINFPVYLSDELHHSYHYLSTLFSRMHGTTLKQYIIAQRIEQVKHLLVEEGLGLSEIAWRLGYCSVPHLSNQFKKITGATPTQYKSMAQEDLISFGIICESCKQRWMALLQH